MSEIKKHGGVRSGAGRPKGQRSKRTEQTIAMAEASGLTPLEIMLESMRRCWADAERLETEGNKGLELLLGARRAACDIAKDAAPYVHARLSAIEHSGEVKTSYVAEMPAPAADADSWATQHHPKPLLQ